MFAIPEKRQPITIYVRVTNAAGHIKILRRVLPQALVKSTAGMQLRMSGAVTQQSLTAKVYDYVRAAGSSEPVPSGMTFIPWALWTAIRTATPFDDLEEQFDGLWSANFGNQDGSWIVETVIDYEFPGTNDGWYIGSTPAQSLSLARAAELAAFSTLASRVTEGAHRISRQPESSQRATEMTSHVLLIA